MHNHRASEGGSARERGVDAPSTCIRRPPRPLAPETVQRPLPGRPVDSCPGRPEHPRAERPVRLGEISRSSFPRGSSVSHSARPTRSFPCARAFLDDTARSGSRSARRARGTSTSRTSGGRPSWRAPWRFSLCRGDFESTDFRFHLAVPQRTRVLLTRVDSSWSWNAIRGVFGSSGAARRAASCPRSLAPSSSPVVPHSS